MTHTAVLVPARDEAPRLAGLLAALRRALPGALLLVVDSASRDGTGQVALRAGARVLRGPPGYAAALAAGYRACRELGVQRLVQLDADGQHPPGAAPLLLAALEGADLVFASRQGTHSPAPLARRAGNALLAALLRAGGLELHDVTSGYWAMNRRAIELFAEAFPLDAADANVRLLAHRAGLRLAEIRVSMPPRRGGRSMHRGLAGPLNFARSLRALAREALRPAPSVRNLTGSLPSARALRGASSAGTPLPFQEAP